MALALVGSLLLVSVRPLRRLVTANPVASE
jgi:hypothetical protein